MKRLALWTSLVAILASCTTEFDFPLADIGEPRRRPMEFTPPANLPPPGYSGDVWVDTEGCVFLRAGEGGTANWVPQIDSQRIQICEKAAMIAYLESNGRADEIAPDDRNVSAAALSVEQALQAIGAQDLTPAPAPASAPAPAQTPATPAVSTSSAPKTAAPPKPAPKAAIATANKPTPKPESTAEYIQVALFPTTRQAKSLRERLEAEGLPVLGNVRARDNMTPVLLGPFRQVAARQTALEKVWGLGYSEAFFYRK